MDSKGRTKLVLSRNEGECITIGDDEIEIEVVRVGRRKARISVLAPTDVKVDRKEIYEQKKGNAA